ncbi:MAG: metal-dependent hydrolase [Bacteroidota bacterium]
MKVTFYGHACFSIETKGKHLLFDPFITPNELAKDIKVDELPADYIFLSHGHEDHVADAVSIAKRTGALVVAPYEVAMWMGQQGVSKVHPMNHGGKKDFNFGTIKMTGAVHSSVLPDGTYGGHPAGYILKGEKNIYYSGDTALTLDMQLVPRFAAIDLAIFPIGDNFTMGAEDASTAAEFVGVNRILGVHFDTFGYIQIDHEAVKKTFSDKGLTLEVLDIGGSLEV